MAHDLHYRIRSLHRDVGFFLVGLTLVYVLSGILLIYRDTGFLQTGHGRGHEYVGWVQPFTDLHKANSKNGVHWFTMLYGVSLGFLAVSSFWMVKPGAKSFKREMLLAAAGLVFAALLVGLG